MLYLRRGEVTPPYGTELRYVLKAPIISGPFSFVGTVPYIPTVAYTILENHTKFPCQTLSRRTDCK